MDEWVDKDTTNRPTQGSTINQSLRRLTDILSDYSYILTERKEGRKRRVPLKHLRHLLAHSSRTELTV